MTHDFPIKYSRNLKVFKENSNRGKGEYKLEYTAKLINNI